MNPIQLIFGLVLALFIPGFLLTKIIFKKQDTLEMLAFSVIFSIVIDIMLGLLLGFNEFMASLTGGISVFNVWFYLILISLILLVFYIFKGQLKPSKK